MDISASEASYNMLSSQCARALLNEGIQAGVLPIPPRFDISPTCADDASATFKLEFRKEDAMAYGLPETLLLKIIAPLDPFFRTESEVAILTIVRQRTRIPVQKVYYFNSNGRNILGLEWILLSAPLGMPLDELVHNDGRRAIQWPADRETTTLSLEELHLDVLRQLQNHLNELLEHLFDGIGSLYCNWATGEYFVGPLSEWTLSRNRLVLQDRELVEASRAADVQADKPASRMMHGNLHAGNILVDTETLEITCYLDWSTAVIAPLEMLSRVPVLALEEEI
jgi:hypothetical protein